MNLISSNNVDKNRYELEVEISAEEFEEELNKAFLKRKSKISIPGFRKGKASRHFIEKYYGENVFYEDAVNSIYPKALDNAIKEAKLDVINDKIDFDLVKIGKEGFTFKATVTVKPEVFIDSYKGIEVTKKSSEVTDEDINKELDKIRERNSRLVSVENRPAKKGDLVVIDFKGSVDGKFFEGGSAEKHNLKLGSNQFIPGFEDQIIGHNIGEEFDINVKFPEDYGVTDLAGKDSVFNIKLHEIKEYDLPVLDDEFAKDVSEFDTLDEYKNDVKKNLSDRFKKDSEDDMKNQIIEKVVDLLDADIPEAMFNNKIEENLSDFSNRLHSQGLDLDTYMKYTGMTIEKFKEEFRPNAERQVKLRLALEKISEKENLKASDEEIENKYKEYSDLYKVEVEKLKGMVSSKDIAADISCEKAMDFLKNNAIIK